MKKLLINLSMFSLFLLFTPFLNANVIDINKYESHLVDFDVHFTITSGDGCKFTVDGTVTTSWGNFASFSGTVTASGSGDCPNDTWTFGMVVNDDGSSKLYGGNEFTSILENDSDLLRDLVVKIQHYR